MVAQLSHCLRFVMEYPPMSKYIKLTPTTKMEIDKREVTLAFICQGQRLQSSNSWCWPLFVQSQNFTLLDEDIYHQVIPSFWKQKLRYYSSASQSCRFWGWFVEIKDVSNRPVYFQFSPSYFPTQLLNDMRIWKGFSQKSMFSLSSNTKAASASVFFIPR